MTSLVRNTEVCCFLLCATSPYKGKLCADASHLIFSYMRRKSIVLGRYPFETDHTTELLIYF
jgi:hypothetical protein